MRSGATPLPRSADGQSRAIRSSQRAVDVDAMRRCVRRVVEQNQQRLAQRRDRRRSPAPAADRPSRACSGTSGRIARNRATTDAHESIELLGTAALGAGVTRRRAQIRQRLPARLDLRGQDRRIAAPRRRVRLRAASRRRPSRSSSAACRARGRRRPPACRCAAPSRRSAPAARPPAAGDRARAATRRSGTTNQAVTAAVSAKLDPESERQRGLGQRLAVRVPQRLGKANRERKTRDDQRRAGEGASPRQQHRDQDHVQQVDGARTDWPFRRQRAGAPVNAARSSARWAATAPWVAGVPRLQARRRRRC